MFGPYHLPPCFARMSNNREIGPVRPVLVHKDEVAIGPGVARLV